PGVCRGGLCSAAWRPGRSLCQTGLGRARTGLQGRRPPTASRVPPGPFFPVFAFPFPEFLSTFRQRLGQAAKEIDVLERGGPGLAVGGEALRHRKGKERKKHFSYRSWSGNQKGCGIGSVRPNAAGDSSAQPVSRNGTALGRTQGAACGESVEPLISTFRRV
ncbi:hypothetical protein MC885_002828, partial [Smutsia gigantea]